MRPPARRPGRAGRAARPRRPGRSRARVARGSGHAGRGARRRRAGSRRRAPPAGPGSGRRRRRRSTRPGVSGMAAGSTTTGAPSASVKTSCRFASITGSAPGAPAARAASVETPATGMPSANDSARAVASAMRMPVKLPGPMPTATPSRSAGRRPAADEHRLGVLEHRDGPRDALVEHLAVAGERGRDHGRGRVEGEHDHERKRCRRSAGASSATRRCDSSTCESVTARADGRKVVAGRLGPLDEADGVVEVGLEVAPLGGGDAGEAVQVEVRDVDAAVVAVADRERRARDRLGDAERPAGAAHEGRLAGAELARDADHVAGLQAARPGGPRSPRSRRVRPTAAPPGQSSAQAAVPATGA